MTRRPEDMVVATFEALDRSHFGGRLCPDQSYGWRVRHFSPQDILLAQRHGILGDCHSTLNLIRIRPALGVVRRRRTLLHEMCHAVTEGFWSVHGHGPRWRAEMLRLAFEHGERWAAWEALRYARAADLASEAADLERWLEDQEYAASDEADGDALEDWSRDRSRAPRAAEDGEADGVESEGETALEDWDQREDTEGEGPWDDDDNDDDDEGDGEDGRGPPVSTGEHAGA